DSLNVVFLRVGADNETEVTDVRAHLQRRFEKRYKPVIRNIAGLERLSGFVDCQVNRSPSGPPNAVRSNFFVIAGIERQNPLDVRGDGVFLLFFGGPGDGIENNLAKDVRRWKSCVLVPVAKQRSRCRDSLDTYEVRRIKNVRERHELVGVGDDTRQDRILKFR